MGIIDTVKSIGRAVRNLFTKRTVMEHAFQIPIISSESMENAITLWSDMYYNRQDWLKNGNNKTLSLPSAVASELARLTVMELDSSISGNGAADYLDKQYQRHLRKVRKMTEYACAEGGIVIKPYVTPTGRIQTAIVHATDFFPVKFDDDQMTGAVFSEVKMVGQNRYTRLEWHDLTGNTYTIRNKVYMKIVVGTQVISDTDLGREVQLTDVDDWASIQPEVTISGVDQPLFAYFKMPMANGVDAASPLGVSAYAKAVDLIQQADEEWTEIWKEYRNARMKILADADMFQTDAQGNIKFDDPDDQGLFRTLDGDGNLITTFAPAIRDAAHFNYMNNILKKVEFLCGLAYGTLSDPQNVDKTAEEIKASKQRSFSTVTDIQKAFQTAHEDLIYAMYVLATIYNLCPKVSFDSMTINFTFDDSLVTDREKDFNQRLLMVNSKLMKPEDFVGWYHNVDPEKAKELLPESFDDTEEKTDPDTEEE